MKQLYLIFSLIIALTSCAQSGSENDVIENELTNKHITVMGTGVSLIPPAGYVLAANFPGFMKNQQSAIFVSQYINQSYESTLSQNGKDYYTSKGATQIIEKQLTINGYSATLLDMTASAYNKAYGLVIGDSLSSVMIMATCSISDSIEINELKHSLLSVHYDDKAVLSPLESSNFELDVSSSVFKFSDYAGGTYVYTYDGKPIDHYSKQPILNVSPLQSVPSVEPFEISEVMFQSMVSHGFVSFKEDFSSNEDVNGYNASERIFDGKLNGLPCKMYLLIITESDKALSIQGIVKSEFEKSVNEIKSISRTVKFK